MTKLIGGIYNYDADGNRLTHRLTAQAVQLSDESPEDVFRFDYEDKETKISFAVEKTVQNHSVAVVDFNRAECKQIARTYGLWRRVSYFLLDSLAIWFYVNRAEHERFWRVDLVGGWANGEWIEDAVLQAVLVNPSSANLDAAPIDEPHPLFDVKRAPVRWEYNDNAFPEAEFSLRRASSYSGRAPLLSPTPPVIQQLAAVPFFARDDGRAFLYHRYMQAELHRGEDYSIEPYYGYVNERCGFTIRATSTYGVFGLSEPVLTKLDIPFEEYFGTAYTSPTQSLYLSKDLWEELLFALIDINRLTASAGWSPPVIPAREDSKRQAWMRREPDQMAIMRGLPFGGCLSQRGGLPISNCLGVTSTAIGQVYGFPIKRRGLLH